MTTRTKDEWTCSVCGKQFGRHDMWHENDVCGPCQAEATKVSCPVCEEVVRDTVWLFHTLLLAF